MDKLKVAIVGSGSMGLNHIKKLTSNPNFEVACIVDANYEKALEVAKTYRVKRALSSIEEIDAADVDAVFIISPSELHEEHALQCIEMGLHVFIEKPICTTNEGALKIQAAAKSKKVIVQVGHIERFNTAYRDLKQFVNTPVAIEVLRLSPSANRINTHVVLDLMIHDIDLVLNLVGLLPVSVKAHQVSVRDGVADYAAAILSFSNGLVCTLTASRIHQEKVRTIKVIEKDKEILADLITRKITETGLEELEFKKDHLRQSTRRVELLPSFSDEEPLIAEHNHFYESVAKNRTPVTGVEASSHALEVALAIINSCMVDEAR